ncbi:MAG: type IV toxin-antitoxin system AbiEi family antitoxin domain-containing protein [Actinomycetaceae bacterium]|nr:type IV toxin-antitoxin system AbiEi family antitoxin domain-containing protein [Actinomycetaceae bacterium]
MTTTIHDQRILSIASARGVLRARDLDCGASRKALSRMAASGLLEKVGWGLYGLSDRDVTEHEDLVTVAAKVPRAVFCLLTALQFHDLTTHIPKQVWLAMPRGSHTPRMSWPPLKMIQTSDELLKEGVEHVTSQGVGFRVYSPARTVVDCFKHRNKIGLDVALEALRDARQQRKVTSEELWHYAKLCRVSNVMRPYLEVVQ